MNKYGLFGSLQAKAGKGDELGAILLEAANLVSHAKGCQLYIVSKDTKEPDRFWVNEVWDTKQDHDDSLSLPGVRELIVRAMPLFEGQPQPGVTLEVIGGKGVK